MNTALSPTVALTLDLIRQPSVTPFDADCQRIMIDRFSGYWFHHLERMRFGDG